VVGRPVFWDPRIARIDLVCSSKMNRRSFCQIVTGSLVAGVACTRQPGESASDGLARLLGLGPAEHGWLRSLSAAEQQELYVGLTSSQDRHSARMIELLMKVIGRRERLFAYVGYPPLPNRLSACDGLLRE
jgi:hypothetical protein